MADWDPASTYDSEHVEPFVAGRSRRPRQNATQYGGIDRSIQGNNISTGDRATILTPRTGIDPVFPNAGALNLYTPAAGSNGVGKRDDRNEVGQGPGFIQGDTYIFKGVPFAAGTAGDNRFRPAQPTSWSDTRAALAYGPICPQNPWRRPRCRRVREPVHGPLADDGAFEAPATGLRP